MAVIKWQIAVLLTVALARLLHRHLGIAAAVAWTIWSVAQIRTPLLLLIQLGCAWGAFWAVDLYQQRRRDIKERDATIDSLRQELEALPQASRERIRSLPTGELAFLYGDQHRRALLKAVRTARRRLTILSGWISSSVVDDELLRALWEAIGRGVRIHIGYGYQGFSGKTHSSRASEQALEGLRKLAQAARSRGLKGGLQVHEFPNHEKIVLIDSSTLICGSHNWLSNGRFDNSERSIVVRDRDVVGLESERIQSLFEGEPVE